MAELGLPVVLNAGSVGSVDIEIPIAALRSKSVRITVRDVLIAVSPNPDINVKKAQLDKHLYAWRLVRRAACASSALSDA